MELTCIGASFYNFWESRDPVSFLKAYAEVEAQAVRVIQLAVAGKFDAALPPCPVLAGGDERSGDALAAMGFYYVHAFQIAHGQGVTAFDGVPAELALREAHRLAFRFTEEDCRIRGVQQHREFGGQRICVVFRPVTRGG